MDYYMKRFDQILNSDKDFGMNLHEGDGLTVQVYHLRKATRLMEREDGQSLMPNGNHVIVYLVLKGKAEIRMEEECVVIEAGQSITVYANQNFSLWALEDTDLFSAHNTVEPDVDNTPRELVNAVKEVELADTYLKGHNYRVGKYSTLIMQAMKPARSTINFHIAASYHDVGKVVVPSEILNKNGRLTAKEFEEIRKHPAATFDMLKEYIGVRNAGFARWHHEKLDGSGYPDHLEGDQIPLESRIMAVADIFDALTTSRCYRAAFSFEKALEILQEDVEHGKVDGAVVAVLRRMVDSGLIVEGVDNLVLPLNKEK